MNETPRIVCVLNQKKNLGLCPVRSTIVLEGALRTKSSRVNLTSFDLRDHPGKNQTPQKDLLTEVVPSGMGMGDTGEAGGPLDASARRSNVSSQP